MMTSTEMLDCEYTQKQNQIVVLEWSRLHSEISKRLTDFSNEQDGSLKNHMKLET